MADRRETKRTLRRLEQVKTWQLVILFILSAFISATFLRLNNVGMVQRRDAVIAADAQGDDQQTLNRLYELQVYSSGHMNAASGDVYLDKKYARDVKRITDQMAAASVGTTGETTYKKADNVCKPQFSSYSLAYAQCMFNELDKYKISDSAGTVTLAMPSVALYKFAFVSPLWSPDFAGISVIVTAVIGLLIIIRLIAAVILRLILRTRYKSAA